MLLTGDRRRERVLGLKRAFSIASVCAVNALLASVSLCVLSRMAPAAPVGNPPQHPEIIYGDDDRRDLYQPDVDPRMVELARSTAVLARRVKFIPDAHDENYFNLLASTLQFTNGLCPGEPFADQPAAGYCSGFLVAPDLIATAGHCIRTQEDCDSLSIAFDFAYETPTSIPTHMLRSNVYQCASIVGQNFNPFEGNRLDFAIIKLDRPVTDRSPMPLRRSGQIGLNEGITLMGYPNGIPLKIASGATTRAVSNEIFFVANPDSFAVNSGSAVVNTASGEVEGILVRGERDFVQQGSCVALKRCAPDECRGEDVTKIAHILPFVPSPPVQ